VDSEQSFEERFAKIQSIIPAASWGEIAYKYSIRDRDWLIDQLKRYREVVELARVWRDKGKWEPGSERKAFRYALDALDGEEKEDGPSV